MVPKITARSPDDAKEYLRLVYAGCEPSPKDEVMKEVYAMSVAMARRKDQDDDYKMMVAVYAEDLQEFPLDIVRDACKGIRKTKTFFPTLSEICDGCRERFAFRRALLRELEMVASGVRLLSGG